MNKNRKSFFQTAGLIYIEVFLGVPIAFSLLFFYNLSLILFLVTTVTIMALALCIIFYWRKKSERRNYKIFVVIALLLIWILPQIFVLTYVEADYFGVKKQYLQEYGEIINNGEGELNASWEIVKLYKKTEFEGTYGKAEVLPLNRMIYHNRNIYSFFVPIAWLYLFDLDGLGKLVIVQKRGCCAEFAQTVTILLKDVTGLNTRVVGVEGIDHAFPEVEFNNDWWVFDVMYTTSDNFVEAPNFAPHLKRSDTYLYNCLATLKDKDTGETLLAEHGFTPSNLTISVIQNITNNPFDDAPATNAEVEIFAFQNHYDPLVANGGTDNFGNYSVTLNSGKEYLILTKEGKLVGLARINLSSPNESIVIYLHKYE